jgi:hypothetical protein
MKRYILIIFIFINSDAIWSQTGNSTCATAIQVCPNIGATFPASTSSPAAEVGPNYGCLSSRPNPAWFFFQVNTPGTHSIDITNSGTNDLDFIVWGPFSTLAGYCNQLTAGNIVDCSYAGGGTENVSFSSTTSGDYYVLLITNFSNQPTNVNFIQNSGTGNFNCEFTGTCLISLTTANVGTCDSLTNQYNVSGLIYTFNAPTNGSLTVNCLGVNSVYDSTLPSPIPYTLTGLPSNGAPATINFQFSAEPTCIASKAIIAPPGCLPCTASVTQNGPICEGEDLILTTNFESTATYQWVGPNGFTSTAQNPVITGASILSSGTYTVLITGQNCVGERSVDVEVISVPKPVIFEAGTEVCEGEILFLGAAEVPGATFTWSGPNGFTANARNTQILNSNPTHSGTYIVQMTLNNCTNRSDTVTAIVFPSPEISISGDTIQVPGSTSVFHVNGEPGYTYFWIFGGNTGLINNTLFTPDRDSVIVFWKNVEGEISLQVIVEDANGCISEPFLMNISVTNSTGMNFINDKNLSIYPNPAKDYIKVISESDNYIIFDFLGREVNKGNLNKANKEIDVSKLLNGIYFISVNENRRKKWCKFIIEK